MFTWLFGVPAQKITDHIYRIDLTGYGPADVGPYDKLRHYVGRNSGLECHHIVEDEHLRIISTPYFHANGPSVAIPAAFHRQLISPRFTAEMNALGGRRGGLAVDITKDELLELYEAVYTWHTSLVELYRIARNILI